MMLLRKITVMAMLGAIGAFVGAVLGELLFVGEPVETRTDPRAICLLFDVSGSMGDRIPQVRERGSTLRRGRSPTQLEALKDAASDFVARQDLTLDPMGLVVFASGAHVVTELSDDAGAIKKSIRGLNANGGTNLGRGFDLAVSALDDQPGERWILVFTDGKPETSSTNETPEAAALSAAARARDAGIQIVAIGTGLADEGLLAAATGSPDNVIVSDPGLLQDAFRRSENVINNRQLLASQARSGASFQRDVALTAAWSALIAIGAGVGLVIGYNRHVRRRPISPWEMTLVIVGGVATGLVAGGASQSLFYVLSSVPAITTIGRVLGWTLLGCGVGFGMGFFVPNLNRRRASAAGAAGGAVAAFCFLTLSPIPAVGDMIGRLLAATILGLSTGLMMVLVEAVSREAFLVVHWSAKERSTLTLGSTPILVGSSSDAHVLLAEDDSPAPIMARISMTNGAVRLQDHAGGTHTLNAGDVLEYGRIRIEVCASGAVPAPAPKTTAHDDVPDSVKRARAPESSWYEAEEVAR